MTVRVPSSDLLIDGSRPLTPTQQRKTEIFQQLAHDHRGTPTSPRDRRITFRFGLQPIKVAGISSVEEVHLLPTHLRTSPAEVVRTSLVLRAVGYAVSPVPALPFDHENGTIANVRGRVIEEPGARQFGGSIASDGPNEGLLG